MMMRATFAENLSIFGHGGQDRLNHAKSCPEMYLIVMRADQQEINKTYPPDANGNPTYIRDQGGKIVRNTEEARAKLYAYEHGQ